MIGWILTTFSLIGTVLNVKKHISCFYIWVIANIAWMIFDIMTGLYSRALLDLVQLFFAIWGIIEWRKKND
jgi:nicotinamide mononucleotide transporter